MRTRSFILIALLLAAMAVACSKKRNEQANESQPGQESSQQATAPSQPATTTENPPPPAEQPKSAEPAKSTAPQAAGAAAAAGAATGAAVAEKSAPPPPPPPPPRPTAIPAGMVIAIRTTTPISTKTAKAGDTFEGSLENPIVVETVVIAPKGAPVIGKVVESDSPGKFKGEGKLSLKLAAIKTPGGNVEVATAPITQTVKGKGKRSATMIGGGAAGGALIGGLAGGGKGAAIGALVGGGAGTAGAGMTGNKELEVPAESVMSFKLSHAAPLPQ